MCVCAWLRCGQHQTPFSPTLPSNSSSVCLINTTASLQLTNGCRHIASPHTHSSSASLSPRSARGAGYSPREDACLTAYELVSPGLLSNTCPSFTRLSLLTTPRSRPASPCDMFNSSYWNSHSNHKRGKDEGEMPNVNCVTGALMKEPPSTTQVLQQKSPVLPRVSAGTWGSGWAL